MVESISFQGFYHSQGLLLIIYLIKNNIHRINLYRLYRHCTGVYRQEYHYAEPKMYRCTAPSPSYREIFLK